MNEQNVILEKSMEFAIRIVNLYKYLSNSKKETVMSKQLLSSWTSVGANIREAKYGQSKADFISKMSVSLKDAAETGYWLELLYRTEYLTEEEYESMRKNYEEIIKLLTSIVKNSK